MKLYLMKLQGPCTLLSRCKETEASRIMIEVSHAFTSAKSPYGIRTPRFKPEAQQPKPKPNENLETVLKKSRMKKRSRSMRELAEILPLSTVLAYATPKFALQCGEAGTSLYHLVYTEVRGMNIGMLAFLNVLLKSIDILIGAFIGYLSDNTRTRWGRRRPFIAAGFPIAAIAVALFSSPPESLGMERSPEASGLCEGLQGNCSAIAKCVAASISDGDLPVWSQPVGNGGLLSVGRQASPMLGVWFFFTRFAFYAGGHTIIAVPYDALGMELTTNFDQRSRLFGFKGLFGILGVLAFVMGGMIMAKVASSDISLQASILGRFAAMVWVVMATICLTFVHETRQSSAEGESGSAFVPTVREMLSNGPYVNYLCIRFCFALGFALFGSMFIFYMKYSVQVNNLCSVCTASTAWDHLKLSGVDEVCASYAVHVMHAVHGIT